MTGLRAGSVCTGYGGLDAAVTAVLGGELTWVADNDPDASKLLAHHFPSVANLGDITAADWAAAEPVDIMAGGTPCQDVSAAGKQAGLKPGTRSGVFLSFAKAIGILRPRLVVIENVLGLLTARGDEPNPEHLAAEASRDTFTRLSRWPENELALAAGKGDTRRARQCRARIARLRKLRKRAADRCQWHEQRLIRAIGTVLASLAGLGYDAEWVTVTAAAAGAPHRRARVFILAFPAQGRAVAGVPLAVTAGGTWAEPDESLFGTLPFAGRIPGSGRMAGGRVYAAADASAATGDGLLPTPTAQLNAPAPWKPGVDWWLQSRAARNLEGVVTGNTPLLKTPTAQLAVNGGSQHPARRREGGHGPTLADQVEHELLRTAADADLPEAVALLPTPRATDGTKGGPNQRGSSGDLMLPSAVTGLLPTPRAQDARHAEATGSELQRDPGKDLLHVRLAREGGVLLPTPQATDGQGGPRAVPEQRTHRGQDHGPRLRDVAPALLPTPVAADGDRASLNYERGNPTLLGALLPTPSVGDGAGGHKTRSGDRKDEPLLGGIGMLLPTPSAMDSHGAWNATAARGEDKAGTGGWTLSDVTWGGGLPPGADAGRLLPTPAAGNFNDGEDLASWEARRRRNLAKGVNGNGQGTPLPVAVRQLADGIDWGQYGAGVRRWEAVLGRSAPRPTVPGRTGERLNPELPEWMMGLPAGWVTGVPGLSRNAMLKLAGNGVVPQQAVLAVRLLLARVARDKLVPAVLAPFLDRAGLGHGEAA